MPAARSSLEPTPAAAPARQGPRTDDAVLAALAWHLDDSACVRRASWRARTRSEAMPCARTRVALKELEVVSLLADDEAVEGLGHAHAQHAVAVLVDFDAGLRAPCCNCKARRGEPASHVGDAHRVIKQELLVVAGPGSGARPLGGAVAGAGARRRTDHGLANVWCVVSVHQKAASWRASQRASGGGSAGAIVRRSYACMSVACLLHTPHGTSGLRRPRGGTLGPRGRQVHSSMRWVHGVRQPMADGRGTVLCSICTRIQHIQAALLDERA
jgi:hypothetical protein